MSGKVLRLKRLLNPEDQRIVILPMDHGVSCGPIPGLERMESAIATGIEGGADAFVLHKGMLRYLRPVNRRLPGVFMHLSASTQLGPAFHSKVAIAPVEEALRRGIDGVSIHINLGDEREPQMLRDFGMIAAACEEWQIPLLVMIYVRGNHAPSPVPDSAVAHAARVAAELGADIVKIPAPKDPETFGKISSGTPIPVVVAGGSKTRDLKMFLNRIESAVSAGMAGVAIGRNVFQHSHPVELLRIISAMVHENLAAQEALERLQMLRSTGTGSPPGE